MNRLVIIVFAITVQFASAQTETFKIDSLTRALEATGLDSGMVEVLNGLCREYRYVDINRSIDFGNQAVQLAKKINYKNGLGKAHIFLGVAYYTNGNLEKALVNYFKSLTLRQQLKDKKGIAACLNNIGLIYYEQDQYHKAISYLEKSVRYARETSSIAIIKAAYKNLSEIYNLIKDYRNALEYDQLYSLIQDSLLDVEKSKRITQLESLYEKEKNRREIESLRNQQKLNEIQMARNRQLVFAVSAGLVIALILVIIILRGYRQKQRSNRLLREQKHELEKLSIVAEQTDSGVLICDAQGNLEWFNQGMERLTGYNLEQFKAKLGCTLREISSNKDIDEVLEEITKKKRSDRYESFHVNAEGRMMWTASTLTPVFDQQGKLSKIVSVYNDITELKKAEESIREKNKDITDSIEYASTLQDGLLPSDEYVASAFPKHFIYNEPRDIVSGDFYWAHRKNDRSFIAAVDCTGHGVPGAFVSMIGINLLNQIIIGRDLNDPGKILTMLNQLVRATFQEEGSRNRTSDGMDMALCTLNNDSTVLEFAGAINPMIRIRDGQLTETGGDRKPIGGRTELEYAFKTHRIEVEKGDTIYLFSDGYIDQFGGARSKKLLLKNFKELLLKASEMPMEEQREFLHNSLIEWQGEEDRVDDILVIGFEV